MSDEQPHLLRRCNGPAPSGFNITLHIPVMRLKDVTSFSDGIQTALTGASGHRFRFEETLIVMDNAEKSEAGTRAVLRAAGAGEARRVVGQLSWTNCVEVHAVSYSNTGATSRALRTLFGEAHAHRVLPHLNNSAWFSSEPWWKVRPGNGLYKTSLQLFLLLSNAYQLRTRYVLHEDGDGLGPAYLLPPRGPGRVSSMEAFVSQAIGALIASETSLSVHLHRCHRPQTCHGGCMPDSLVDEFMAEYISRAHALGRVKETTKPKTLDAVRRHTRANGITLANRWSAETFIADVERIEDAFTASPILPEESTLGIENILWNWYYRYADRWNYMYLPSNGAEEYPLCHLMEPKLVLFVGPEARYQWRAQSMVSSPLRAANPMQPWKVSESTTLPGFSTAFLLSHRESDFVSANFRRDHTVDDYRRASWCCSLRWADRIRLVLNASRALVRHNAKHPFPQEPAGTLASTKRVGSGVCGYTDFSNRGECETNVKGAWELGLSRPIGGSISKMTIWTQDDCVAACRLCSNCNFVSFSTSPGHRECAWYNTCDMDRLVHVKTAPDYTTVAVSRHKARAQEDRESGHGWSPNLPGVGLQG